MSESPTDGHDIDARARALYGRVDWRGACGLLHVAAIHGPSHRVLAIGPAAPKSETDRFALGLARARADVLVTTGSILRAEPELVHCYAEAASQDRVFARWRATTLSREASPRLLVLSASGQLPRDHPALRDTRGWIWTTQRGASQIGRPPSGFEPIVRSQAEASIAHALEFLFRQALAETATPTVLLEAGPTTTAPLYAPDARPPIDELLLSRFEGPIAIAARGPAFPEARRVERRLGPAASRVGIEEPSGRWTIERHRA